MLTWPWNAVAAVAVLVALNLFIAAFIHAGKGEG